jgi:hypothetical protein
MEVCAMVRKNQVWIRQLLKGLEFLLDLGKFAGEKAIPMPPDNNAVVLCLAKEPLCACTQLPFPLDRSAENHPRNHSAGVSSQERQ